MVVRCSLIARNRAGTQTMFPEAEVGAWQYFILLFSQSPKSNASVSKLVMSHRHFLGERSWVPLWDTPATSRWTEEHEPLPRACLRPRWYNAPAHVGSQAQSWDWVSDIQDFRTFRSGPIQENTEWPKSSVRIWVGELKHIYIRCKRSSMQSHSLLT